MRIVKEVLEELLKMFMADALLSASVLALVMATALLAHIAGSLVAGLVLVAGNILILAAAVYRHWKAQRKSA